MTRACGNRIFTPYLDRREQESVVEYACTMLSHKHFSGFQQQLCQLKILSMQVELRKTKLIDLI